MITLAATFHCDRKDCDVKVKGRVEVQFLVSQGQPVGEQIRPHVPAGWSAVTNESRIQAPGSQGPQIGPLGYFCTACTKELQARSEAKPLIVGV